MRYSACPIAVPLFMADVRNIVTTASVAIALVACGWAYYAIQRTERNDRINNAEWAQVTGRSAQAPRSQARTAAKAARSPSPVGAMSR